jgi:hypothetical protein
MLTEKYRMFTEELEDVRVAVRGRIITFRVTNEEWKMIGICGFRAGLSRHEWCRKVSVSTASKGYGLTLNEQMVMEELGVLQKLHGAVLKRMLSSAELEDLRHEIDQSYEEYGRQLLDRRGVGWRPKEPEETFDTEVKGCVITFRVTDVEGDRIDECAFLEGLPANEWCKSESVSESRSGYGLTPFERMVVEEFGVLGELYKEVLKRMMTPPEMDELRKEIDRLYKDYGDLLLERRSFNMVERMPEEVFET